MGQMSRSSVLMVLSNGFTRDPRVTNEAESLVRNGYEVTVLCWDRAGTLPPQETLNGIRVVRLRNTAWMRLLPYDLFRLRPFWRLALRRALGLHASTPFAAIHCHDLDTLPVGTSFEARTGLPLIYDAHEIWGYLMAHELPGDWGDHYLRKERRLLRSVDRVITVNDPLRVYFEGVTEAPVTVVMNAKPLVSDTYRAPSNEVFTVLYIGLLHPSRFIEELIEAVRPLERVRLTLGGVGKLAYVASVAARSKESPNVEFLGEVPFHDVIPLTLKADAVLAPFDPGHRLTRVGLPNKVFEAMATGRPIIVTDGTYLAEFTKEHDVGIVVEHSAEGVREGLRRLRDDPRLRETLGKHGLEKALSEFNWPRQEQTLLGVYRGLGLT